MAGLVSYEILERRFGVNRRTIQRWIRRRGFPQPVEFSPGTVRFRSHEVEAWERDRASRRSAEATLSESEAFELLDEALAEITDYGLCAAEMERQAEKWREDPDEVTSVTLGDLYSAFVSVLNDPDTAQATRMAIKTRPRLAEFLRMFDPLTAPSEPE